MAMVDHKGLIGNRDYMSKIVTDNKGCNRHIHITVQMERTSNGKNDLFTKEEKDEIRKAAKNFMEKVNEIINKKS